LQETGKGEKLQKFFCHAKKNENNIFLLGLKKTKFGQQNMLRLGS
jgi:hypothetical protein